MKAKKLLALTMITGLVAGSAVAADAKKKPKTATVAKTATYYLSYPPGDANCTSAFLSTKQGPTGKPACGNGLVWGAAGEVLIASGQDQTDLLGLNADKRTYFAADGVPLILDAKKKLTGQLVVKSYVSAGGLAGGGGAAKVEIAVVGDSKNKEVVLGETTIEYTAQPGAASPTVEFSFDLNDKLNKAKFTSLGLRLRNRGATVAHGFYSTEGDTFIKVPTYAKRA